MKGHLISITELKDKERHKAVEEMTIAINTSLKEIIKASVHNYKLHDKKRIDLCANHLINILAALSNMAALNDVSFEVVYFMFNQQYSKVINEIGQKVKKSKGVLQ